MCKSLKINSGVISSTESGRRQIAKKKRFGKNRIRSRNNYTIAKKLFTMHDLEYFK